MNEYSTKVIRKHLRLWGHVQGVGFRYRACHAADAAGATGWVRNNCNGSVSMEIQGTEDQIDRVIQAIERGTFIRIESMDARSIPVIDGEYGFREADGL